MRKLTTKRNEGGRTVAGRKARAFQRLFQPPTPDPPPSGFGVEPREWIRRRDRQRAERLFGEIRREGER